MPVDLVSVLNEGCWFGELGMIVEDSEAVLDFDEWQQAGKMLKSYSDRSYLLFAWCWGDWLNYGEQKYGEAFSQAMALTGLSRSHLENWKWVARKIPRSLRGIEGLTHRHYIEVAASHIEMDKKLRLLIAAATHDWSTAKLCEEAAESSPGNIATQPLLPFPEDTQFELETEVYELEKELTNTRLSGAVYGKVVSEAISILDDVEVSLEAGEVKDGVVKALDLLRSEPDIRFIELVSSAIRYYYNDEVSKMVEVMAELKEYGGY